MHNLTSNTRKYEYNLAETERTSKKNPTQLLNYQSVEIYP